MHVLTVFDHPQRNTFPGTVLDHFVDGIVGAGHTAEIVDLHAEGFDPRFTTADHAHFWSGPRPDGIAQEAARVDGEANAERRAGYLVEARALGAGLVAPDRVARDVRHDAAPAGT